MKQSPPSLNRPPYANQIAFVAILSAMLGTVEAYAEPASAAIDTASNSSRIDAATVDDAPPQDNIHEEASHSGFEWGLGIGVALPLGQADDGSALYNDEEGIEALRLRDGEMSALVSYRAPLALDLGYRLSSPWWLGLRAEAGLGGFGDECPTGASCHFTDARVLAWLKRHFSPASRTDLWLGVGLGYEWLAAVAQISLEPVDPELPFYQAVSAKQTLSGPLLMLEGGLAFDLGDSVRVGPYLGAALGRFVWSSYDCAAALGCPDTSSIDGGGFHGWVSLGVNGSHGP